MKKSQTKKRKGGRIYEQLPSRRELLLFLLMVAALAAHPMSGLIEL